MARRLSPQVVVEVVQKQVNKPAATPAHSSCQDNLKGIMEQCLREAVEITRSVQGVPFQNEDMRAICSCLFIARTWAT